MERLSRFLQADIVPSIDSLVTMPALGFCHSFSVANYNLPSGATKTMLCFDGCATHLGCSITLRGGSMAELKKVYFSHSVRKLTFRRVLREDYSDRQA